MLKRKLIFKLTLLSPRMAVLGLTIHHLQQVLPSQYDVAKNQERTFQAINNSYVEPTTTTKAIIKEKQE